MPPQKYPILSQLQDVLTSDIFACAIDIRRQLDQFAVLGPESYAAIRPQFRQLKEGLEKIAPHLPSLPESICQPIEEIVVVVNDAACNAAYYQVCQRLRHSEIGELGERGYKEFLFLTKAPAVPWSDQPPDNDGKALPVKSDSRQTSEQSCLGRIRHILNMARHHARWLRTCLDRWRTGEEGALNELKGLIERFNPPDGSLSEFMLLSHGVRADAEAATPRFLSHVCKLRAAYDSVFADLDHCDDAAMQAETVSSRLGDIFSAITSMYRALREYAPPAVETIREVSIELNELADMFAERYAKIEAEIPYQESSYSTTPGRIQGVRDHNERVRLVRGKLMNRFYAEAGREFWRGIDAGAFFDDAVLLDVIGHSFDSPHEDGQHVRAFLGPVQQWLETRAPGYGGIGHRYPNQRFDLHLSPTQLKGKQTEECIRALSRVLEIEYQALAGDNDEARKEMAKFPLGIKSAASAGRSLMGRAYLLKRCAAEMRLALEQCQRPRHLFVRAQRPAIQAARVIVGMVDDYHDQLPWSELWWDFDALRNPNNPNRPPATLTIGERSLKVLSIKVGSGANADGTLPDDTIYEAWRLWICPFLRHQQEFPLGASGQFDFPEVITDADGRLLDSNGEPLDVVDAIDPQSGKVTGQTLSGMPATAVDNFDVVDALEYRRCQVSDWANCCDMAVALIDKLQAQEVQSDPKVIGAIEASQNFMRSAAALLRVPNLPIPHDISTMHAKTQMASTSKPQWDVFISHASEDKESFVRPLAHALTERGLRVWFDEFTLTIGDSLRRSIDHGLASSNFGIVVLSHHFFAKEWPQRELDGLDAKELNGRKVILPVWHKIEREQVERYSPMLAGRLAVSTSRGIDPVVAEILKAVNNVSRSEARGARVPS